MRTQEQQLVARVAELIRDVPDHPVPGVTFKDITPMLADGPTFAGVVRHLAEQTPGEVDLVVGMEARGFILGAPVAERLGVGFIPVRKAGKLPGPTVSRSYELEYGSAVVEVHPATIPAGSRVLVVDDVLATGGTAAATAELLESIGATVTQMAFLLEISALAGRDHLVGRDVHALLTV